MYLHCDKRRPLQPWDAPFPAAALCAPFALAERARAAPITMCMGNRLASGQHRGDAPAGNGQTAVQRPFNRPGGPAPVIAGQHAGARTQAHASARLRPGCRAHRGSTPRPCSRASHLSMLPTAWESSKAASARLASRLATKKWFFDGQRPHGHRFAKTRVNRVDGSREQTGNFLPNRDEMPRTQGRAVAERAHIRQRKR